MSIYYYKSPLKNRRHVQWEPERKLKPVNCGHFLLKNDFTVINELNNYKVLQINVRLFH